MQSDVVPQPMTLTEALERRKQKIVDDDASPAEESEEEEEEEEEEGGGEDAPPRPKAKSRAKPSIKPPADAPALPPLALSTNPLFPNARGPVPQAPKPAPLPQPPVTPRLTGKNAPSTPHSLTTRGSARRGINAGEVTPETAQERLPDEEEEEEEEEEEDQGEGEGQGEGEEGAEMAEDDSMQVDE
jgi:hypothetical protein